MPVLAGANKKMILVVDDESSLVQLCQLVLEDAGFKVRGAYSGRQALQFLAEELPDLVLLDVMMPGMDGIEVCRQIRARQDNGQPRIIMYTADERDSTRDNSLAAGADALITKETPIYDLPSKIKTYLNTKA
jgi:CheY-like chemotaxis protein